MDESHTGYYRIEDRDGVWWFVSPTGELGVSLGVNHVEPMLMLGPYNREATLERYGADFVTGDPETKTKSIPAPPQSGSDAEAQRLQRWVTGNDIEACVTATLDFNPDGEAARKWTQQVNPDQLESPNPCPSNQGSIQLIRHSYEPTQQTAPIPQRTW